MVRSGGEICTTATEVLGPALIAVRVKPVAVATLARAVCVSREVIAAAEAAAEAAMVIATLTEAAEAVRVMVSACTPREVASLALKLASLARKFSMVPERTTETETTSLVAKPGGVDGGTGGVGGGGEG